MFFIFTFISLGIHNIPNMLILFDARLNKNNLNTESSWFIGKLGQGSAGLEKWIPCVPVHGLNANIAFSA